MDGDKEIRIYAYPKIKEPVTDKTGTKPAGTIDSFINRKLAGKIIVLQNDSKARKEEKFVLVEVRTNITGKPKPDDAPVTKIVCFIFYSFKFMITFVLALCKYKCINYFQYASAFKK